MLAIVVAAVGFAGMSTISGSADVYAAAPGTSTAISSIPYTDNSSITSSTQVSFDTNHHVRGKAYQITLQEDSMYDIKMTSDDFDTYLYLCDGDGDVITENDDYPDIRTSRIIYEPDGSDTFYIIATSLEEDEIGAYSLSVKTPPAGGISGTVKNSSGDGVEGIFATAYVWDAGEEMWLQADRNYTDGDGKYIIEYLDDGTYRLRFEDINGTYKWQYTDEIEVSNGQTTANVDATLLTGGTISGAVENSEGEGIEDIRVVYYLYDGDEEEWYRVDDIDELTDSDGFYSLRLLDAGDYKIKFYDSNGIYQAQYYDGESTLAAADTITITGESSIENIDATLTAAGKISGTVTGSNGAKLKGISVEAYDSDENYVSDTYTRSDGTYTIGGMGTGAYSLEFYDDAGNYKGQSRTGINVTAGQTTPNINVTLAPYGKISGTITGIGTDALDYIRVNAYIYDNNEQAWDYVRGTYARDNGTYVISGLNAGNYKVEFYDYNDVYKTQYYNGKLTLETAELVTVRDGVTTPNINAHISNGTTSLLSIAASAGGKITAGAGGQYMPGTKVNITAAPNAGYKFSGWKSSNGGSFANAASASTVFTMPANAATITANFTKNVTTTAITAGTFGKVGDKAWTGKQLKPAVLVKVNGATLRNGTDYTVTYGANKNIGKGTVTIAAKTGSAYTGSKVLTFKIVPTPPKSVALKPDKNQIKVSFKPAAKAQGVTKYTVQYKLNGAKSWTSKTLSVKSGAKTASLTLKNLKKGKTYQVRVSAVKTVSKAKYTSAWTATKTSKKVK
jgi:hypothetical protein